MRVKTNASLREKVVGGRVSQFLKQKGKRNHKEDRPGLGIGSRRRISRSLGVIPENGRRQDEELKAKTRVGRLGNKTAGCSLTPVVPIACFPAMPTPRGDVTALFLGPPGSGKSALIAALCNKDVDVVEIPDGRPDSGIPSLRAAGPGLFLGELSCPPAAPGPWAAEANVLVLVLPGPEGNDEPLAPALGDAARAALARGTPLLAVRNLRPGDSQNEAQARDQTAALLDSAGLEAVPLYVLPEDCGSREGCEELERLRAALRSQAEALQR